MEQDKYKEYNATSPDKQQFGYLFGRHLANCGLPYNLSPLQVICICALTNDNLRKRVFDRLKKLKKDKIIDDVEEVLNCIHEFKKPYFHCDWLMETLRREKKSSGNYSKSEKNFQNAIRKYLNKINSYLPLINHNLYILFSIIVQESHLRNATAPREDILNPDRIFNKDHTKEQKNL